MERDYSKRIKQLRTGLRLTQHVFAGRLHVQPQVVASWEQGRREPSAESYRQLAKLAPPADAWFFLEKIGVTRNLVRAKWRARVDLPPANPERAGVELRRHRTPSRLEIPVLRDGAISNPLQPAPEDIADQISFPASLFPENPGVYVAFHIRGNAMAPVLREGFLTLIDPSQRDPEKLQGRMIGVQRAGHISAKWLAAGSKPGHWVLRAENSQYPDIVVATEGAEFLVGAVVFWWGSQQ
jgi:transcriptional regulator with XRE-family HTH domain